MTEREWHTNIAAVPHDWSLWLEYADQLCRNDPATAEVIRLTYAVTHGHWGDKELHARLAVLNGKRQIMRLPTYHNTTGMILSLIPPGSFVMGAQSGEPLAAGNEAKHAVSITEGFWLAQTTVSNLCWRRLMPDLLPDLPTYFDDSFIPATGFSWSTAEIFCQRLTVQDRAGGKLPAGWRYELPTEAQWEYACRAGTITAYSCGNELSRNYANCRTTARTSSTTRPAAAGQRRPNPWQLYDMHGNVFEMCRDLYTADAAQSPSPDVVYSGFRVARGGSWSSPPDRCRSAARVHFDETRPSARIGLRVALVCA